MKESIAKLPMLASPTDKEELIMYLAAVKEAIKEHDIQYIPRTSAKGQILADFIVERPKDKILDTPMEEVEELPNPWVLFTDGSSCVDGSGAGLLITNPEGIEFTYALREKNHSEQEILAVVEEEGHTWMTPIHEYLTEGILLEEKKKARAIRRKAGMDNPFKYWCEKLSIRQCFVSVKHPQANGLGQVMGEGKTPFALTYGAEAVISVEIGMQTLRTMEVDVIKNNEALGISLELLEEKREQAAIEETRSKAKMEKYYNARV
ncbi:hypothetical protein Tco_0777163 [Tanacetum coccineum]